MVAEQAATGGEAAQNLQDGRQVQNLQARAYQADLVEVATDSNVSISCGRASEGPGRAYAPPTQLHVAEGCLEHTQAAWQCQAEPPAAAVAAAPRPRTLLPS